MRFLSSRGGEANAEAHASATKETIMKPFVGQISVYGELCCDLCNEIIHNHLDCPVCGKKYAASKNYHDLSERTPHRLICECGAIFETTDCPYDDKATWRQVPNDKGEAQPPRQMTIKTQTTQREAVDLDRLVRFFYQRVPDFCEFQKWQKRAFYDHARREAVFVLWPFNYAVEMAWAVNIVWCKYMGRESWLDEYLKRQCHITAADYERWRHETMWKDMQSNKEISRK